MAVSRAPHRSSHQPAVQGIQLGLSSQRGAREPCPKAVSKVKCWERGLLRQEERSREGLSFWAKGLNPQKWK